MTHQAGYKLRQCSRAEKAYFFLEKMAHLPHRDAIMKSSAFLVLTDDYYKVYGPLIFRLLKKYPGKKVVLLKGPSVNPYSLVASGLNELAAQIVEVTVEKLDQSSQILESYNVDFIYGITPRLDFPELNRNTRKKGIKWIALPYAFEEFWHLMLDPENVVNNWDWLFFTSHQGLENFKRVVTLEKSAQKRELYEKVLQRSSVSGNLVLDQANLFDRESAARRLKIESPQPIVLVSTFVPFQTKEWSHWQTTLYKNSYVAAPPLDTLFRSLTRLFLPSEKFIEPSKVNYRAVLEELRKFADSQGAQLWAKTRSKHDNRPVFLNYFNRVFGHNSFFPFITNDLCLVADLFVGNLSAMIFEAISVKKYCISVLPIDPAELNKVRKSPGYEYGFWELFYGQNSLFCSKGVNVTVDLFRDNALQALRSALSLPLSQYKPDPQLWRNFCERLLGFQEQKFASDHVIETLENL